MHFEMKDVERWQRERDRLDTEREEFDARATVVTRLGRDYRNLRNRVQGAPGPIPGGLWGFAILKLTAT